MEPFGATTRAPKPAWLSQNLGASRCSFWAPRSALLARLRLRPSTALGVWVAGVILALVLGALSERLDSSNLRDAAGVLATLVVWEAFLKSLVLGWVLLPVLAIKRLIGRKTKNRVEESRSRQMLMMLTAERLIETLDKGESDPEQLQEIIDKLDELNDNFYA
jgi:hypothetical protein